MNAPGRRTGISGYSLVELLLVLAIVAIVAITGLSMLRPRTDDAVRGVVEELEGVITNAQHSASLSSQDIYISTTGNWEDGSFVIDPRPLLATVATPPSSTDLAPGSSTKRQGSTSECYWTRYLSGDRVHMSAGVDTTGAWLTTALGSTTALQNLTFLNSATMAGIKTALGTALCTGSLNSVVFNSVNRTYDTGFYIAVLGLVSGQPKVNGPIGILVVPAAQGNVYKFLKLDGTSTWRRM